jgi:hypothetical protein
MRQKLETKNNITVNGKEGKLEHNKLKQQILDEFGIICYLLCTLLCNFVSILSYAHCKKQNKTNALAK